MKIKRRKTFLKLSTKYDVVVTETRKEKLLVGNKNSNKSHYWVNNFYRH